MRADNGRMRHSPSEEAKEEPGSIWWGDELVYRISDAARAKLQKKRWSLWIDSDGVRERQNRVVDAVGLPLAPGLRNDWWRDVDLCGMMLCTPLDGGPSANLGHHLEPVAKAAENLKQCIINLFETHPDLDDALLWELIGTSHVAAEHASRSMSLHPSRQRGRPEKRAGKRILPELANLFREGFEKNESQTRGGPFERFCSAIIKEVSGQTRPSGWIIETMRGGVEKSQL